MAHRKSVGSDDYTSDKDVLRLIESSRQEFEAGNKAQLMKCVFRCARFQAVIPEWAVDALLEIEDGLVCGRIADFIEAFGKPEKEKNTRAALARLEKLKPEALVVLTRLRAAGGSLNSDDLFEQAVADMRERGFKVTVRDIKAIYDQDRESIRLIPRASTKKRNYGVSVVAFPATRRSGRKTLKD